MTSSPCVLAVPPWVERLAVSERLSSQLRAKTSSRLRGLPVSTFRSSNGGAVVPSGSIIDSVLDMVCLFYPS